MIATPVLLQGGTEFQTLALAKVLIDAGYRVSVGCYYEHDPGMVSGFQAAGAEVVLMNRNRSDGLVHLFKGLVRLFGEVKPDIVHVQYLAPGFVPLIAARCAGIKTLYATVHQPGGVYGRRERALLRVASHWCTAFFSVSLAVERSWFGDAALFDPERPRTGRRHGTIYNALDTPGIIAAGRSVAPVALRGEWGIAAGDPVVGFVGRLRREKGLDILIRAMPAVAASFPAVRLVVVGDGPEAGALRDLALKMKVADRVVWSGMCDRFKTWRQYAGMDLAAAPSRFEGFGLAAAEAQACGVPVVAADVDGLREVVADGETGLLVPPGDPRALAAAIVRLLGAPGPAREMGRRGRVRVEDLFSVERFTRATLSFYDNARASRAVR